MNSEYLSSENRQGNHEQTNTASITGRLFIAIGFILFFVGIAIAFFKGSPTVCIISFPVILIGFLIYSNSKKPG
jgi:hypothetical protein